MTRKKRSLSEDEHTLWTVVTRSIKPLRRRKAVVAAPEEIALPPMPPRKLAKAAKPVPRDVSKEPPQTAERRVTVPAAWPLPVVIVAYHVTVPDGLEAKADAHEGSEMGYFARDEIPWDALAFRSTREALEDWFRRPGV